MASKEKSLVVGEDSLVVVVDEVVVEDVASVVVVDSCKREFRTFSPSVVIVKCNHGSLSGSK